MTQKNRYNKTQPLNHYRTVSTVDSNQHFCIKDPLLNNVLYFVEFIFVRKRYTVYQKCKRDVSFYLERYTTFLLNIV